MAENLKVVIDDFVMKSKKGEEIPDEMFELFDLANHISKYQSSGKQHKNVADLKQIVKMDKVVDLFRDLPISDQKECND